MTILGRIRQFSFYSMIGMILVTLTLMLAIVVLAIENYWQEVNLPEYEPKIHRLARIKKIGLNPSTKYLFIHGLAASSAYWQRTIESLPVSASVIAPDLLGFGNSPKPKATYDLPMHANAIRQLLEEEHFFDNGPIVLVAHSMGTLVALELMRQSPTHFNKAILISLPFYESSTTAIAHLTSASLMSQGILNNNKLLKLICFALHGRDLPHLGTHFGLEENVFQAGVQHRWQSLSKSLNNSIVQVDVRALMATISLPIVLVHGLDDVVAPINSVRKLPLEFNNLTLIEIPESDHQVIQTRVKAIIAIINNTTADDVVE